MKSYRLNSDIDIYPYEIEVYDPRSKEDKPDWFTDLLKFDGKDENGFIKFQETWDENGGVTYPIPKTNGHLYIPVGSVVARDLSSGWVFPFKLDYISEFYNEKLCFKDRIIKFFRSIINKFKRN